MVAIYRAVQILLKFTAHRYTLHCTVYRGSAASGLSHIAASDIDSDIP